jgi:hypothetical protein
MKPTAKTVPQPTPEEDRGEAWEPDEPQVEDFRQELVSGPDTHNCTACGRYAFPVAGVTCYWCRRPQ